MQVTRQRRRSTPLSTSRLGLITGRRARIAIAGTAVLAVTGGGLAYASTVGFGTQQVGQTSANGEVISSDQVIKPLGDELVTAAGKFMGSTVSPNGKYFAATSTDKSVTLQVVDLSTYKPVAAVGTGSSAPATLPGVSWVKNSDGTVGQEGPIFSPTGDAIYVPVATGVIRYPFSNGVISAGTKLTIPNATIPPTNVNGNKTTTSLQPLTAGLALSPDGSTLYAAVNGENKVVAIDSTTGAPKGSWNVGIAPRHLSFVGNKLYVTNEGGRLATAADKTTMLSYGTQVPADGYKGTSVDGTVSVIDTANASAPVGSIDVGLHPTRSFVDHGTLYVANTNSDTISVIDTASDKVVQTINTQPWSGSDAGYEPSGITVQNGHLIVALGRANALAVYKLGTNAQDPVRYVGLVPTDYYPENVFDVGGQLVVSNRRGIDARGPQLSYGEGNGTTPGSKTVTGHGTHSTTASVTRLTLPADGDIRDTYTPQVFSQNGWTNTDVQESDGQRAANIPAVAVPQKIGDPSTIKHVFLIVKENRTYDQVLGDMTQGDGDPTLAQFGQKVTPNQHALATQFGLYDNTYDTGTNSSEGHNWLMQGDNPEYTESTAGESTRSYDTEEDVLGHQRNGFLWTAVEDAGKSAKNFGEFEYTEGKPAGATWQQYYCATTTGTPSLTDPSIAWNNKSVIPSLAAIDDPNSPSFDTSVPDIYREKIWQQDFEKNGPANFNMMWFSSDHTSGQADPVAQVADNDLAVGRVVDEISHSKYWKDSVIFVAEDDSQNGADHIDGHRAPVQVISPYAVHGKTVSTYYSQISMVRTIEQILGAQPLNQKVAAATPMYDAFTNTPDLTPFNAQPNQISLTQGLTGGMPTCAPNGAPIPEAGTSSAAAAAAAAPAATSASSSDAVPADKQALADAWKAWVAKQHLEGNGAKADFAAPEAMNRYTWYATHNWSTPYPGDSTVLMPSDVPGAFVPAADTE